MFDFLEKKSPGILDVKSIFSDDELKLYRLTKGTLRKVSETESRMNTQFEFLLKLKDNLAELNELDTQSKTKLKNLVISKTHVRPVLESKLEEMRKSITTLSTHLATLRKYRYQKILLNTAYERDLQNLKQEVL